MNGSARRALGVGAATGMALVPAGAPLMVGTASAAVVNEAVVSCTDYIAAGAVDGVNDFVTLGSGSERESTPAGTILSVCTNSGLSTEAESGTARDANGLTQTETLEPAQSFSFSYSAGFGSGLLGLAFASLDNSYPS